MQTIACVRLCFFYVCTECQHSYAAWKEIFGRGRQEMENRFVGSPSHASDTRGGYDSSPLLSAETQAALSDEKVTIEGAKTLYRELHHRMEASVEFGRLGSFSNAYVRCQEDFKALLLSWLHEVNSALEPLGKLVADMERRVTEVKRACTC